MRKLAFFVAVFSILLVPILSSAQQADAMLGFGTLLSSGGTNCVSSGFNSNCVGEEKGGLYTTISGDVIFHKRIGFNFEANWRTKQGLG